MIDGGPRAFRDFGCYNTGPRHGLFLIDREGSVVTRFEPTVDMAEVKAAVEAAL